jgi:hypothetical protein
MAQSRHTLVTPCAGGMIAPMRQPPTGTIETVRGHLAGEAAEAVLRFWAEHGALEGDQARARLPEVICVLKDESGQVAGVNSAFPDEVELIAHRRFWVYRSFLVSEAAEAGPAMISHAFEALQAEFEPGAGGPIGLCVLVRDRAEMERRPQAEWSDPRMLYAGYDAEGAQVRIGYFAGATI